MLTGTPVLLAPDLGVGMVLLQADSQGLDKPVCYHSKKFEKHQMAYSTIEEEILALLVLQHFEVYLGSTSYLQ